MKTPPSTTEMDQFEMAHDHGGNGWFVIEYIDNDYCRLSSIHARPIRQAFLAWKPKLSVYKLAPSKNEPEVPVRLDKNEVIWFEIQEVRQKIKDGHLVVRGSHIVNAV